MTEVWKDIEGYEGLYQVSNLGRVKRLAGKCRVKGGERTVPEKILKGDIRSGYRRVQLCKEGVWERLLVHRIVTNAFIPNPDNLPCVNHKDENPSNNNVENLEWCTHKYNSNYGTSPDRIGEKLSKKVYQYSKDGTFIREWKSLHEIRKELGYNESCICLCCNGKQYSAYGYKWSYRIA